MDRESGDSRDLGATSKTEEFYRNLSEAFRFFNARLFEGALPDCLITLRSSNRFFGYHHTERFIAKDGQLIDELGLHPGLFAVRSMEEALSTLVHEMVHHWQAHFGSPTRTNPHNEEWAAKMEAIGLMPSSTGLPGGAKTGRRMTHYIIPDGPYIAACKELLDEGFEFIWHDRFAPRAMDEFQVRAQQLKEQELDIPLSAPPIENIAAPKKAGLHVDSSAPSVSIYSPAPKKQSSRMKWVCPGCESGVWATKPVWLVCGVCDVAFELKVK
ncbi:SprT-like domain-containing protein [Limnobacter sp.]|uniref:SprT-like domain-containing protein n=1 Tax=Limnobacter sp. TaxID=2003368 RepID=UPI003510E226